MTKRFFIALIAVFGFGLPAFAQEIAGNGLHKQPWFLDSFLEFGADLEEAAAAGKDLLVIVEQDGCPYCRELHRVNFARTEITDYIKANYVVIQLDLYGSRGTVDFDGQELEERDLVEKWGAHFTPTSIVFSREKAGASSAADAEVFRLPGYLKPFHYMTSLEYVTKGEYKNQSFQRFLKAKIVELEAKGIHADVW